VKQSEVIDWAMRGVIDAMQKEPDEEKKVELNKTLKELAMMFVLAEREERGW
jgi:hypothetical protein